jgi:hypothetical protein
MRTHIVGHCLLVHPHPLRVVFFIVARKKSSDSSDTPASIVQDATTVWLEDLGVSWLFVESISIVCIVASTISVSRSDDSASKKFVVCGWWLFIFVGVSNCFVKGLLVNAICLVDSSGNW